MWAQTSKAVAAFCISLFAFHAPAHAQDPAADYPHKPVRFVVAFAPGGATDVLARLVANQLSKDLGHQVIVENRDGGSGVIAVQAVLSAPADGYTVLVGGSSPMVFNHLTIPKLSYKPSDITPVTILGSYPIVIATNKNLPAHNFQEVIKLAKSRSVTLSYGHPGPAFQLQANYLNSQLGIKMLPVPYRGAGPAAQGLMAGDTDLLVSDTTTVAPMHQAGRALAVAVTTKQRSPILPEVPTVAEATGLTDFDASAFAALGVHRATPPAIVLKLQQAVAHALTAPDVRERLKTLGILAGGNSPAEAAARVNGEIERYKPIAEAAGLKGNQ